MPETAARNVIRTIADADAAVAGIGPSGRAGGWGRAASGDAGLAEPRAGGFEVDRLFAGVGPNHLLARLTGEGTGELDDVDMLEVLLFLSGCRGEARAVATRLVERFGSLGGVLGATTLQLRRLEGVSETTISMLKATQAALRRVLRGPLEEPITIGSWRALTDYLGVDMRYERVETLRLLFLDRKNHLIRDETMHRGTVDHTPLYPREVARRALELQASALIMAHNHPSGDPSPSTTDIETTKQVQQALAVLGVTLHDHIILARRGVRSLRTLGYIATR
ncbi:MAG: RadC family protein [Alphaproteobacteria bacterium]